VVGWSYLEGGSAYQAFLYDGSSMNNLGTLGGSASWAMAINDSGQVVGNSRTADNSLHAFLYDDIGGMLDLNDLIALDSGWTLWYANDININGQIVGIGSIDGEAHAFFLTPATVPTPSAILLGTLGLGFAGWMKRRRII